MLYFNLTNDLMKNKNKKIKMVIQKEKQPIKNIRHKHRKIKNQDEYFDWAIDPEFDWSKDEYNDNHENINEDFYLISFN